MGLGHLVPFTGGGVLLATMVAQTPLKHSKTGPPHPVRPDSSPSDGGERQGSDGANLQSR